MPYAWVGPSLAALSILVTGGALARRRKEGILGSLDGDGATAVERSGGWGRLLVAVGRSRLGGAARSDAGLAWRVEAWGRPQSLEVVIGAKVALAVALSATAVLAATTFPPWVVVAPVAALLGYRFPDFVVARLVRRRQRRMGAQVVELVEILLATAQAGLGPSEAIRRTAPELADPLGSEVRTAARAIDLGADWRSALADMGARLRLPEVDRVTRALSRSQSLGGSVGGALRSLAGNLRAERRTRAQEIARRAPVTMLFPLIFLILPAFLLLTVGPVLLATIHSLQAG